tara:strand:- start:44 stop:217 length:174 start_codon:yes stop_codon:yes gene_type:complete
MVLTGKPFIDGSVFWVKYLTKSGTGKSSFSEESLKKGSFSKTASSGVTRESSVEPAC